MKIFNKMVELLAALAGLVYVIKGELQLAMLFFIYSALVGIDYKLEE